MNANANPTNFGPEHSPQIKQTLLEEFDRLSPDMQFRLLRMARGLKSTQTFFNQKKVGLS